MAHSHPLTPCALLGEHFTRSPEVFTLTLVNTHDTFTHYLTLWSVYFSCLIKQFFFPHSRCTTTRHWTLPWPSISWIDQLILLPSCTFSSVPPSPVPVPLSSVSLQPHFIPSHSLPPLLFFFTQCFIFCPLVYVYCTTRYVCFWYLASR